MSSNILVTGAAGFIGGSIVKNLTSRRRSDLQGSKVIGAVRTPEQAQSLAKGGIDAVQVNLDDDTAIEKCVLENDINIVVHTASSAVPKHPVSLIRALSRRNHDNSKQLYYIHSGITALFTPETGWPYGRVKDSDTDILTKEREIGTANPVRATDIIVVDEAKAHGVQAFNIAIPMVYGIGSGEWKKVSSNIPAQLRSSLKNKLVRKFEQDAATSAAHISDLTALYALLVKKLVAGESLPHNEQGYIFAFAHKAPWHETMDRLAQKLFKRGLVTSPKPEFWPSYEVAAEHLGWPSQFSQAMATTQGDLVAVQAYERLGWQPKWTQQMYLDSMDEEIDGVLEHDKFEPTLYKAMMK